MTTYRKRVALFGVVVLALISLATPVDAFTGCTPASPASVPLADPVPHIPINGTAGFVVPGANTLAGGDLLIGLGYLGQQPVCRETESGDFDQNTLFLQHIQAALLQHFTEQADA